MSRRRTNFNFNSRRMDAGDMLVVMFILWLARVVLWTTVGLVVGLFLAVRKLLKS